jgi:flagellar assembly protein FliH
MLKPQHHRTNSKVQEDNVPVVSDEQLKKAKEEAEKILNQAKEHADQIKRQIEVERQKIEEEKREIFETAKQKGYETGLQLGKEQAYQEMEEQIELAKTIVENARKEFVQTVERSDHTILEIGLKTAEKILNCTLSEQPEKFNDLIKKAITETLDRKEIKIHVHPSLYEVVVHKKEEYLSPILQEAPIYIYPDQHLSYGGCIIETNGERVDASIDHQLHEVRIKLFELLNGDLT